MRVPVVCAAVALALSAAALVGAQTKNSGEDLSIFPGALNMGAVETRPIVVATRSGKTPQRVEWTISNPDIASISPRGSFADITAKSPGRALVTARVAGRTVSANVTVAEESELRFGTARWSVPPVAGLSPLPLLDASRVDDDGPDVFAVDADPMKRFAVVRALTRSGTLVWQSTVRGTPWAGDRFGGLLARLGPLDQPSRTLARLDRPRSIVPAWRYKARGDIDDLAEADDGTIYLVELTRSRLTGPRGEGSQLVVIDGKTGIETGHFPLPASTWQTSGSCVPKAALVRRPSELGSLGEGANGAVYAELLQVHDSWTRVCEKGRPQPGRGRFKVSRELQLVRLTRKGVTIVRTLWRVDADGADTVERLRSIEDVSPGPVAEIKSGELIALRTHVSVDAGGRLAARLNLARIVRGDVVREVTRPGDTARPKKPWRVLIDAPDIARVYFADGSTLQAIDMTVGTTIWSMETAALPFEAIETNSVAANDTVRNQVLEINYRGAILRTFPARVADARMAGGGPGVFYGVDPQTHAIVEVQQPPYVETDWSTMLDIETSFDEVRRRFADFLLETR
jgi:hypothetical protein